MSKILSAAAAVAIVALAGATTIVSARAADQGVSTGRRSASNQYCLQIWRCGPNGCNWHPVCTRTCPDGSYTCTPLYGAYGPWGGENYWGGYTDSGWAYSR